MLGHSDSIFRYGLGQAGAGGTFLQPPLGMGGWAWGSPLQLLVGGWAQSGCAAPQLVPRSRACPLRVLLPPVTTRVALSAGSRKLEYNGQTWHEHCFICSSCQQPIGSRSFIPDQKDYYCVPCYESKFAPRCTRCKKVRLAKQPKALSSLVQGHAPCSSWSRSRDGFRRQHPSRCCSALQPVSLCVTSSLPADPDQGRSDLPGRAVAQGVFRLHGLQDPAGWAAVHLPG